MSQPLLTRLVLPVANEEDAKATCHELRPHLDETVETLVVVHVIEKAGGYMDKAPLEAREEQAERVFSIVEDEFRDGPEVHRELRYGTDVVDEIVAASDELEATAIGFTPQSGGRLTDLLSGNTANRLITESHRPVVVFPLQESDEE